MHFIVPKELSDGKLIQNSLPNEMAFINKTIFKIMAFYYDTGVNEEVPLFNAFSRVVSMRFSAFISKRSVPSNTRPKTMQ